MGGEEGAEWREEELSNFLIHYLTYATREKKHLTPTPRRNPGRGERRGRDQVPNSPMPCLKKFFILPSNSLPDTSGSGKDGGGSEDQNLIPSPSPPPSQAKNDSNHAASQASDAPSTGEKPLFSSDCPGAKSHQQGLERRWVTDRFLPEAERNETERNNIYIYIFAPRQVRWYDRARELALPQP